MNNIIKTYNPTIDHDLDITYNHRLFDINDNLSSHNDIQYLIVNYATHFMNERTVITNITNRYIYLICFRMNTTKSLLLKNQVTYVVEFSKNYKILGPEIIYQPF